MLNLKDMFILLFYSKLDELDNTSHSVENSDVESQSDKPENVPNSLKKKNKNKKKVLKYFNFVSRFSSNGVCSFEEIQKQRNWRKPKIC
jgi:hypothetical protein